MIRNLIFDWSGTLVDDVELVLYATNTALVKNGGRSLSLEEFKNTYKLPYSSFYADILPEVSFSSLDNTFKFAITSKNIQVKLCPHVLDFLNLCQQRQICCFILSSVNSETFLIQSNHFRIRTFFSKIYTDVIDKRIILKNLIEENHLNKLETAFIGDMVHDIESAQNERITSIAVLTGYQNVKKLAQQKPDIIIKDLKSLQKILF